MKSEMAADALRIAITADPEMPVPPKHYGGIERIVDMLIRGLVKRGHNVTLFAHRDSIVPCRVVPYAGASFTSKTALFRNTVLVSGSILSEHFDIVHSFGRLAYMLPALPAAMPKLMSYQREITARNVKWGNRLSGGTLHFCGCSRYLIRNLPDSRNCHVVYNGVPVDTYEYSAPVSEDAPLVFLGRVEAIKGPHVAIEVARRTGRRLVLAGNIPNEAAHREFFNTRIAPHVDGKDVQYVGPVTDAEKNDLLGGASALLMPILWDEPFGIVMAEALACGTPVIALNRGSVPEIVENGVNGFICTSVEEMAAAVERVSALDRHACRRIMESRFSDTAIVSAYENLYFRLHSGRMALATSPCNGQTLC